MGGKSGSKAASREAERARAEEEARQQRIRQGTADINRVFDGGLTGTGAIGKGATYDPNAKYYNADGSLWTPTASAASQASGSQALLGGTLGTLQAAQSQQNNAGYMLPGAQPQQPSGAQLASLFGSMNGSASAKTAAEQFAERVSGGGLYSGTQQSGGFNDAFYRNIRDGFTNYAMPQLNQQRDQAAKELTFSLDRSGQLAGSVRGQKTGELQKMFDLNEQQIRDQALAHENTARNNVENARADLIGMLNATGDNQQAVNSALSRSTILTQPQAYSPLGQLFTDFTSQLGGQAARERAEAASGGMYKAPFNTGLFGGTGQVTVRR